MQRNEHDHPHAWRVRKSSPRMTPFWAVLFLFLSLSFPFPADAQANPTSPDSQSPVAQAEKMMREGKNPEAIAVLNELAAKQPNATGLEAALGKAYFQSKKFPQAIQHLKSALQANAEDLESTQILALSYCAAGEYALATPLLEKLGPRLPATNADGPYLLGICYLMTQRWDDARTAFAKLFAVSPDSAMAYLMLGKILIRQQMEDRAVPQIEKALQIDPRLPMAHFLLGEIDLYKQNTQLAVTEFQKELAINPTVWLVYWRLGDAYFRMDLYEQAENVLKQSIWLNDSSSGAYIVLGQIALKREDPSLAAGFLERALKLDPQNFYVHYFLGRAYQSLGRTAEAEQHFEISKKLRNDRHEEERRIIQELP